VSKVNQPGHGSEGEPQLPRSYSDDSESRQTTRFSPAKRQQARRRREVLTMQMEMRLAEGPFRILDIHSYKRADKLAIKHKFRELRQFLIERAEKLREVSPKSADKEVQDWLHFFRYEGRGRPRGTGHPKVKIEELLDRIGIDLNNLQRLQKAGMTARDIKVLYALAKGTTQKGVAEELGVTAQAVNKRLNQRIYPALKRVNPRFSLTEFRAVIADRTNK
jgi:hypothetical protein